MADIKYSDLQNFDEFPELPAVLYVLDSVRALLKEILPSNLCQRSGDCDTLAAILELLNNLHSKYINFPIVPF